MNWLTGEKVQTSDWDSNRGTIAKIGQEVSGGLVLVHGLAIQVRHGRLWHLIHMYYVVCCDTVGNVTVSRVSTDRNGSKNGYAKNTVHDDVGIRVKWDCEVLWGVRGYRCYLRKWPITQRLRPPCSILTSNKKGNLIWGGRLDERLYVYIIIPTLIARRSVPSMSSVSWI